MAQYCQLPKGLDVLYKPYDDQHGSDIDRSSSSEDDLFLEKSQAIQTKRQVHRCHYKSIVVHLLLLTCNLTFCLGVWHWFTQDCPYGAYGPDLIYSRHFHPPGSMHILLKNENRLAPAKDAIEYESQQWDHTNIYFRNGSVNAGRLHKEFGPPSQKSDDAWADLIQCKFILTKHTS